jgi:hypothetical protein
MKPAVLVLSSLLACAHAPPPASAPAAPAARPALALTVGEATYPGLDAGSQAPEVAEPACLAPRLEKDELPAKAGVVLLGFAVGADGAVQEGAVLANSAAAGPATLHALEGAVKACRWIPARSRLGLRVGARVQLPFVFREASPAGASPGA